MNHLSPLYFLKLSTDYPKHLNYSEYAKTYSRIQNRSLIHYECEYKSELEILKNERDKYLKWGIQKNDIGTTNFTKVARQVQKEIDKLS